MVANEPTLTLEGAGLFAHALSTHRTDLDVDFFTAVDDKKDPSEDTGAGMMGTLEFNSACYYRYIGLNLDMLFNKDHLAVLTDEERKKLLEIFIRASILAVPSARKNTMFGWNPPEYVMGLVRTGQPLSLINAFEKPVAQNNGFVDASRERLKSYWKDISGLYQLEAEVLSELPPDNIDELINKLVL